MGRICFHSLVLSGWKTEQPSPECFLPLVQVPRSEFCKTFQKKFRFPNGTLESLKVYDPHLWSEFLTIFYLLLRLICGAYGQEVFCIPWLPVFPSRKGIREGLVLRQILILWRINVRWRGRKWTQPWMEFGLSIWTPYFATLLGMEDGTSFLFSHSFFREDTPLSFADRTLNSLKFCDGKTFVGWMGTMWRFWVCDCGGIMSGKGGCQYPE